VNGPQHGYYIHGKNPNGTSEGTAADLKRFLQEEENPNNTGTRGLLKSDRTEL